MPDTDAAAPAAPAPSPPELVHLARALALAERGRATVGPNPLVGCVLTRDGREIGRGWHERPGGPHAEVAALTDAGDARGATAWVSLEPCNHTGRTGPCTDALAAAGVARVVYATRDPDPVAGGGAATLARSGVSVTAGPFAGVGRAQNATFLRRTRTRRPFVTLKLAQTASGALTPPGGRGWITGEAARTEVHRLRAAADGVLVGAGTVIADDPRLDVRHVAAPRGQPRPVVLDARGRLGAAARVLSPRADRPPPLVLTTESSDPGWRAAVERSGGEVAVVPAGPGGVDPVATLTLLAERGMTALLAEPGPTLAARLVSGGLVDRLVLHVASGSHTTAWHAPAAVRAHRWHLELVRPVGEDLEVTLLPAAEGD